MHITTVSWQETPIHKRATSCPEIEQVIDFLTGVSTSLGLAKSRYFLHLQQEFERAWVLHSKPAMSGLMRASVTGVVLTILAAVTTQAAGLSVVATVLPRTRLEIREQPTLFEVTSADLERGYVDAPLCGELHISVNHDAGFLLRAELRPGVVSRARIELFGRTIDVAQAGGWLDIAGGRSIRDKAVARFYLRGDAVPGIYDWPVRFSVVPMHRTAALAR